MEGERGMVEKKVKNGKKKRKRCTWKGRGGETHSLTSIHTVFNNPHTETETERERGGSGTGHRNTGLCQDTDTEAGRATANVISIIVVG